MQNEQILFAMSCEMNEEDYVKATKLVMRTRGAHRFLNGILIGMVLLILLELFDWYLYGYPDWQLVSYMAGVGVMGILAVLLNVLPVRAMRKRYRQTGDFEAQRNYYFYQDRIVATKRDESRVIPWQKITKFLEDREVAVLLLGNEMLVIPARAIDRQAYSYLGSLVLGKCGMDKRKIRHVFQPNGVLKIPDATQINAQGLVEEKPAEESATWQEIRYVVEYPMLERMALLRPALWWRWGGICVLTAGIASAFCGWEDPLLFVFTFLLALLGGGVIVVIWWLQSRNNLKKSGICRVELWDDGIRFLYAGTNRMIRWEESELLENKNFLVRFQNVNVEFIPGHRMNEECKTFLREKCPPAGKKKQK